MNKHINRLLVAAVMAGASALAFAADTSATITVRKTVVPVGVSPQMAYVHVDVPASAVSANALTFDVPAPKGASNIIGFLYGTYNVSGSTKPLTVTRSGKTVTVTGSNMTSGTLAISDTIRGVVVYKP